MLYSLLGPATKAGLAVIAVAVDLRSGEIDVASNVNTGSDHVVMLLQKAADIVATGKRTVDPPLESDE